MCHHRTAIELLRARRRRSERLSIASATAVGSEVAIRGTEVTVGGMRRVATQMLRLRNLSISRTGLWETGWSGLAGHVSIMVIKRESVVGVEGVATHTYVTAVGVWHTTKG